MCVFCACVGVYVNIYTPTTKQTRYTIECAHVCSQVCICMCVHICINLCTYMHMHIGTHACEHYIHVFVWTCAHAHARFYEYLCNSWASSFFSLRGETKKVDKSNSNRLKHFETKLWYILSCHYDWKFYLKGNAELLKSCLLLSSPDKRRDLVNKSCKYVNWSFQGCPTE